MAIHTQLPDNKDPDSPATTSIEWDAMIDTWLMIETVLGGTQAMREAGRMYLPQHTEESDPNYEDRLLTNILFNSLEITLDQFVGRPFSEPMKLNEDVPEDIASHSVNIDLQGSNINTFCRDAFREGLAKGFVHVIVDMPALTQEERVDRTLADDANDGRRPYWVIVKPENVIFAEADLVVTPDGEMREWYTHVRIRENIVRRVGFAQEVVERIRVLEPGVFQVWEKIKSKKKKEEWRIVEQGETGIPFVPMLTYYSQRNTFLDSKPPLEDLAFMNVRHWQSMSDQINILTVVRFPMLAVAGATDVSGSVMRIGPRQLLGTKDANGRFYYVEHTGRAIQSGLDELNKLEEDMMSYGATFLKQKTGNETATAKAIDSAEANSELQDMTIRFTDFVNNCLAVHAAWMNLPTGGTVELLTDFGPDDLDDNDTNILMKLRDGRDISQKAVIEAAIRRGILPEDFDAEADVQQIIKEDKELKPFQPQVPGTFDVKDPDADGKPGITRPNSSTSSSSSSSGE
ncbi:MAG: DUF4055 domain-containing protein [Candidatus Thorarchaeota archaeon]|jgi:hypothetical protein